MALAEGDGDGEGEILLRGPQVFGGYWRNEEATAEAFTADGWFRTGDVGRLDADGALAITGRLKEMILTGGLNVSPREVELVLEAHPAVRQAAVVGRPSERWGEEVVAFVVPENGSVDDDALLVHARERLSGHKCPKRIFAIDALPAGETGKVRRSELVEMAIERDGRTRWTSDCRARSAFVTGGSMGIGYDVARQLAEEGAAWRSPRATPSAWRQPPGELSAGDGRGGHRPLPATWVSWPSVERTVEQATERLGRDRHARDVCGQLPGRPARGAHRGGLAREPEPQVHGLRAHVPRRDPAHARQRGRERRPRGRQRRPEAELLGDDRGRGQRRRPELRVLARRAVRPPTGSA